MKTIFFKVHNLFFALLLVTPIICDAQKDMDAKAVNKEFAFDRANKPESFTFNVTKNTNKLIINFEGEISEGSLKVKITDPDGNKISGFSLVTSNSENKNYSYSYSSDSEGRSRSRSRSTGRSRSSSSSTSSSKSGSSASVSVSVGVDSSETLTTIKEKDGNNNIYTKQQTKTDNRGARGVLVKEIKNPTEGEWEFTIYPKDASGNFSADISYK